MDYIVNSNGTEIVIKIEGMTNKSMDNSEQRIRLLGYYSNLIGLDGDKKDSKRKEVLERIVNSMTELEASQRVSDFEERFVARTMAYASKIAELYGKDKVSPVTIISENTREAEDAKALASAINDVIDAEAELDPNEVEIAKINGNNFRYQKGSLDIRDYAEKLYQIGNESKGNTWTIYLDNEGELVIY